MAVFAGAGLLPPFIQSGLEGHIIEQAEGPQTVAVVAHTAAVPAFIVGTPVGKAPQIGFGYVAGAHKANLAHKGRRPGIDDDFSIDRPQFPVQRIAAVGGLGDGVALTP